MIDGNSNGSTTESLGRVRDEAPEPRFRVNDFAVLLKPKILALVVFTALVGILMAPGGAAASTGLVAVLCIALGAGAAGAINMWYDRDIDQVMRRTQNRPLPAGRMDPRLALAYGAVLAVGSVWMMAHHGAAADGRLQFRRRWRVDDPRAAVLLVHGIGEHSGRYEHVGSSLAAAGVDMTSPAPSWLTSTVASRKPRPAPHCIDSQGRRTCSIEQVTA